MKKNNLLFYMHDSSIAFRFELSGNLSGDGVRELEQAWRTAASIIGERCLVVDLSFVIGIDDAGRELLGKWHDQGARLVAGCSAEKARIQSMIDRPLSYCETNLKLSTWHPFRVAPVWLAAFLILLFPGIESAATQGRAVSRHHYGLEAAGSGRQCGAVMRNPSPLHQRSTNPTLPQAQENA